MNRDRGTVFGMERASEYRRPLGAGSEPLGVGGVMPLGNSEFLILSEPRKCNQIY